MPEEALLERSKFENMTLVKREASKALKEVLQQEYQMIKLFRPDMLKIDADQGQDVDPQNDKRLAKITIDLNKLKDKEYLEGLKQAEQEHFKDQAPQVMSLNDYIAQEKENTDLFLFIKYVCPNSIYKKYFKRDESDIESDDYKAQIDTASKLLKGGS